MFSSSQTFMAPPESVRISLPSANVWLLAGSLVGLHVHLFLIVAYKKQMKKKGPKISVVTQMFWLMFLDVAQALTSTWTS